MNDLPTESNYFLSFSEFIRKFRKNKIFEHVPISYQLYILPNNYFFEFHPNHTYHRLYYYNRKENVKIDVEDASFYGIKDEKKFFVEIWTRENIEYRIYSCIISNKIFCYYFLKEHNCLESPPTYKSERWANEKERSIDTEKKCCNQMSHTEYQSTP